MARKAAYRKRRQNRLAMLLVTTVVLMMMLVVTFKSVELREKQSVLYGQRSGASQRN